MKLLKCASGTKCKSFALPIVFIWIIVDRCIRRRSPRLTRIKRYFSRHVAIARNDIASGTRDERKSPADTRTGSSVTDFRRYTQQTFRTGTRRSIGPKAIFLVSHCVRVWTTLLSYKTSSVIIFPVRSLKTIRQMSEKYNILQSYNQETSTNVKIYIDFAITIRFSLLNSRTVKKFVHHDVNSKDGYIANCKWC